MIISMVSIYATCNRRLDCFGAKYSFSVNVKAYPNNDSIRIGDTIWIELNEPVSLTDHTSGNNINYSGAENLGMGITIDEFVGGSVNEPGTVPAATKFYFQLEMGSPIQNTLVERVRSFNFSETQGNYRFKVGIVPKQKGIYGVAISNAANVYRNNDKCTKANFNIIFANTNQHLYFYESNRPGYTISEYEKTHLYCFKVK